MALFVHSFVYLYFLLISYAAFWFDQTYFLIEMFKLAYNFSTKQATKKVIFW